MCDCVCVYCSRYYSECLCRKDNSVYYLLNYFKAYIRCTVQAFASPLVYFIFITGGNFEKLLNEKRSQ